LDEPLISIWEKQALASFYCRASEKLVNTFSTHGVVNVFFRGVPKDSSAYLRSLFSLFFPDASTLTWLVIRLA